MTTPQARVERACRSLGRDMVVQRCQALLAGGSEDDAFLVVVGGPAAVRLIADGLPEDQAYWLRVWAARGLLWAGPGSDDVLLGAIGDEHWRVREMASKVVARHGLGELLEPVAALEGDPVRRVRTAAGRAVRMLVELRA